MTQPLSTSNERFLSTVAKWIEETGEVFVVLRFVYGAGSKSFEFFTSMSEFKARVAELRPADSVIVMQEKQLPL